MRVLFDANIILDLLLEREPFVDAAEELWQAVLDSKITGYVSAITPINVFYIGRKYLDKQASYKALANLLDIFDVCTVDQVVLLHALHSKHNDFEDAVQLACAEINQLDGIVTRDRKDFAATTTIRVWTPEQLLDEIEQHS